MHGSIGKLVLNTKMHVTYTIQSSENETGLSGEGTSNNWQLYSTYVSWMREGERWREGGRKKGGREGERMEGGRGTFVVLTISMPLGRGVCGLSTTGNLCSIVPVYESVSAPSGERVEGGREGGREGRREGGREGGGREGEREGGRDGWRERGREGGRKEGEREGGREGGRERGRERGRAYHPH